MLTLIGRFPECIYPAEGVEKWPIDEFTKSISIRVESKIVPDLVRYERIEKFVCPLCKTESDMLTYNDIYKCDCGLKFQWHGSFVYIWR